jgi:hypothetical protein
MTDHTMEVHLQVSADAAARGATEDAARRAIQTMLVDRMADAALGGSLGANPHADLLARAKATEVYVMVMALMQGLAETSKPAVEVRGNGGV